MKIDFNSAMHDMGDDANEPVEQSTQAQATAAEQAAAAPAAAPAVEESPAQQDVTDDHDTSKDPDGQPVEDGNRRKQLIGAGVGLALLAIVGGSLLSQRANGDVSASPAPAPSSASPSSENSPAESPSDQATPEAKAWAFTGTDPGATTIPAAQLTEWCGVRDSEQIVPQNGDFYPGSTALVGPKNTRIPTQAPYPSGWRTCQLGYDRQPVKSKIGFNEIRDNDELLKKACIDHSGFDFGKWKVVNADTRTRPGENNNHDGSVALEGPDGWLADCELSIDQPTATLTFLPPAKKGDATCPRAQAVQRSDMMPNMPPPPPLPKDKNGNVILPMGPDGKPLPPPPGFPPPGVTPERMQNLYWITAFGRVPDVKDLRKTATHATYELGNGTKGDSEIIIKNGVAIANHTWFLKKGDPTNSKPTIKFWDKNHKVVHSCTAS